MTPTTEDDLQSALRVEATKLHHTAKMVGVVRGYAMACGKLSGGDWDMVDEMSDADLEEVIGSASDEAAAIARMSLHFDSVHDTNPETE